MNYQNKEIKIEDLVTYLNNSKINLSPVFQRGHVWTIGTRRKLIKNMLNSMPIPAIFIYKEESGATYTYNILDGKQRIESLILFIGNRRADIKIDNWTSYFFKSNECKHVNFGVKINETDQQTFQTLQDDLVRKFREYLIPTIEITMDENTSLDEIISLFVDINQQGVKVERFHIVKALCQKDLILKQTFNLLSIKQTRKKDIYFKTIKNDITFVLKKLNQINKTKNQNTQVNKMWEKLLEICLFYLSKTHKKPSEIMKEFIANGGTNPYKLTRRQISEIKTLFKKIKRVYQLGLADTKLATDATHFYTFVTTYINRDFSIFAPTDLCNKLNSFAHLLSNKKGVSVPRNINKFFKEYIDLSAKHTTDTSRRERREELFYQILKSIS